MVPAAFGHAALEAARQVSAASACGRSLCRFHLTASAADMRAAADVAASAGIPFTDAIMGAYQLAHARPALPERGGSGRPTADAARRAQAIAGAGDAVRLKLLRSIMTKGMERAVERMVAAESMGSRASFVRGVNRLRTARRSPPFVGFLRAFARAARAAPPGRSARGS